MTTLNDSNRLSESRKRLILDFKNPKIVRHSKHFLRSGGEAKSYFDFDIILNDPQKCEDVVNNFNAKLFEVLYAHPVDYIGFIEKIGRATVGAIRIASSISIRTGLPTFVIRLAKELVFEKIKILPNEGTPALRKLSGLSIVIITDHITTGKEVIRSIDAVNSVGGVVTDVVTYTLKPNGFQSTIEEFSQRGVNVHSLFYLYDLEDERYDISLGGTFYAAEYINGLRAD